MTVEILPSLEEFKLAFSNEDFCIGSGRHRIGYRVPCSPWVYKVEKYPHEEVNNHEYQCYLDIIKSGRLPDGVFLPEMHMLENGVIASQYIPGDKPKYCMYDEHQYHKEISDCWRIATDVFADTFDLDDSGAACNVRVVDDEDGSRKVYIIDLGE